MNSKNIVSYVSYDEKAFSRDVIAKWGDINNGLIDDKDLLHIQMAHLAQAIIESFKRGDGSIGEEILVFISQALNRTDAVSEIENAVAISFIEYNEIKELGIINIVPSNILKVVKEQ